MQRKRQAVEKVMASPSTNAELLTVGEVAERLKVPTSWVYERTRKRSSDRLPGFRLGKYWRFCEADLQAWLEQRRRN